MHSSRRCATRYAVLGAALFVAAASAPAAAQSTGSSDDATSRRMASAIRSSALRASKADRTVHDTAHLIPGDNSSLGDPILVPYRETTSSDALPGGFTMQLPNTSLALTNGSLFVRRVSDGHRPNGVHVSVQLTY